MHGEAGRSTGAASSTTRRDERGSRGGRARPVTRERTACGCGSSTCAFDSLLRLVSRIVARGSGRSAARRPSGSGRVPRPSRRAWSCKVRSRRIPGSARATGRASTTRTTGATSAVYYGGIGVTGVPTLRLEPYLPARLAAAGQQPDDDQLQRDFASFPANLFTIDDSYTFTGNGRLGQRRHHRDQPARRPAGRRDHPPLDRDRSAGRRRSTPRRTARSTSATPTDLTGLQLTLQGGVTKGGGGQLVIDTQTIFDP